MRRIRCSWPTVGMASDDGGITCTSSRASLLHSEPPRIVLPDESRAAVAFKTQPDTVFAAHCCTFAFFLPGKDEQAGPGGVV